MSHWRQLTRARRHHAIAQADWFAAISAAPGDPQQHLCWCLPRIVRHGQDLFFLHPARATDPAHIEP